MPKKAEKEVHKGFDVEAYQRRLVLLREIISGENQADFAARLGIPSKRWNNYEQGYPVPRETAFIIMDKFDGMSVEWIWFGYTGNLSMTFKKKIAAAESLRAEADAANAALQKAKNLVAGIARKKAKKLASIPD